MVELFESAIASPSTGRRKGLSAEKVLQQSSNVTQSPNQAVSVHESDSDGVEPTSRRGSAYTVRRRTRKNLKLRHVGVLNTIMHVCLRKGDYNRAGKAFATMLRLEVNTRHLDVRHDGLWGLGAELLLREYRANSSPKGVAVPVHDSYGNFSNIQDLRSPRTHNQFALTSSVFETAKAYYERLILQYPHRSVRPDYVSSVYFYPAMLAFWILQIQTAIRAKQNNSSQIQLSEYQEDVRFTTGQESDEPRAETPTNMQFSRDGPALQDGFLDFELSQARQVFERLSAMINFPPFDQDIKLRNLFGMVSLWIYDVSARRPNGLADSHYYQQAAQDAFKQVRVLRDRL